MNRLLTAIAAFFIAATAMSAQSEIRFRIEPVSDSRLSDEARTSIDLRLEQAFNRTGAIMNNSSNVFAIIPKLEFQEAVQSEGLVQEVARMKATLTLTAVNTADGVQYHSATIPLSASATGGADVAMKALARSLKPTDPVFVRFTRNAREKIAAHYTDNCQAILKKALMLAELGQYEEAISYLMGVPENVPCYDEACTMTINLLSYLRPEEPAGAPADSIAPDTIVIEREVEVPVEKIIEVPVSEPAAAEPESAAPAAPKTPECTVSVDSNTLKFKILSCRGDSGTGRISILCDIENLDPDGENAYSSFSKAFTDNGIELRELMIQDNKYPSVYVSMPVRVPVKVLFQIGRTDNSIGLLSYLEFKIRNVKVTVRNLKVEW